LRHRLAVLFGALGLVATAPGLASASVTTENYLATDFDVQPTRTGFYDYTTGAAETWTTQAEFGAGTLTNARDDLITDAVTLDPVGPAGTVLPDVATVAWWDKNWDTPPATTSITPRWERKPSPNTRCGSNSTSPG
jgi:hypothetical protein